MVVKEQVAVKETLRACRVQHRADVASVLYVVKMTPSLDNNPHSCSQRHTKQIPQESEIVIRLLIRRPLLDFGVTESQMIQYGAGFLSRRDGQKPVG